LSINLAVLVRNPETGIRQFARVKVPSMLSRFISLAEGRYVALEDVIAHHLDQLFSGMEVVQHYMFRVTRNEDVEVEEDDAENLLLALEKELLRRGRSSAGPSRGRGTTWIRRCSSCWPVNWTSASEKSSTYLVPWTSVGCSP
jgi:polyphosphate kinase